MTSRKKESPTHFFTFECASPQEAEEISRLIVKYRAAMNACFREELGHDCTMADGTIVKECLIDGLRVTRKAVSIIRATGSGR